jgi:hypothetical protein
MPKTRRKKINRSPIKNQQINLYVVEQGARIAVNGHRTAEGSKMSPNAKAKPVFVGRTYTGVNKGKAYPYASRKRGGTGKLKADTPSLSARLAGALKDGIAVMTNTEPRA